MSIKGDVEELNKINLEIKRTLLNLNKLRSSKKEVEKRVKSYLKEKELPGVKHQDLVIQLDTSSRKVGKKKIEREHAIYEILARSGIQNPTEIIEKIKIAGKEVRTSETIKIKNINL